MIEIELRIQKNKCRIFCEIPRMFFKIYKQLFLNVAEEKYKNTNSTIQILNSYSRSILGYFKIISFRRLIDTLNDS